jgi:hypothetical protein
MSRSAFLVISLVVFLAGVFLIFSSVSIGREAANAYLRSQGGGMDGTQFMAVVDGSIHTYRWIGGILAGIAGLGLLKAIELR